MSTIFKLNNVDYSDHVVAESYQVNLKDIYREWTDGGQVRHKDVIGQKLGGKFQVYFEGTTDLQAFVTALANCKTIDNTYPVHLKANNYTVASLLSRSVFIDYEPVRRRSPAMEDVFEVFEVTIEEP